MELEWVQKRLYDVDWSNETRCQGCGGEKGTEKHRLYHCPTWPKVRDQIPKELRK